MQVEQVTRDEVKRKDIYLTTRQNNYKAYDPPPPLRCLHVAVIVCPKTGVVTPLCDLRSCVKRYIKSNNNF
jgi:hypothetical protein